MWTPALPLTTYYAAYIDQEKSVPHRLPSGKLENPTGLAYWIPENRYLADYADYLDAISDLTLEEVIVNDSETDEPLIKFYVETGKSAIYDESDLGSGMINLQYSDKVLAYRKRDNGILGVETLTGIDTRLGTDEAERNPDVFPPNVPTTTDEEADFSNF